MEKCYWLSCTSQIVLGFHFCLGPLAFSNESQCDCVLPGVAIAWGMWCPQFLTACRPRSFHSLIQMITCHLTTKKHVNFNSLRWWFCLFCHVFGGKRHCKSKWDKLLAMYLQLKYTDIMHYSFHTCSCLGRLHAVCLEGFELHVPTLNTYFASVHCLLTSKVITCTVSPVRSQARAQAKPVTVQPSSKSRNFELISTD